LAVELAGEGTDTVYASVSYQLADNVENLVLVGNADINAVGNAGNNRLEGNAGRNILFGGLGSDTYVFGRGSGQDVVANFDAGKPSGDRVLLGAGVAVADVHFNRSGTDLLLAIDGTPDQLRVLDYFVNGGKGPTALEKIRFADGTSLNHAAVVALADAGAAQEPDPGPPAAEPAVPPAVRTGDASPLYTPPALENSVPQGYAGVTPQSVAEAIALARQQFEQKLKTLRVSTDDAGSLDRSEFVERRALPLLWNLQESLLNLQLAKNADGRFTGSLPLDSRMLSDLSAATGSIGALSGRFGSLDQVVRPDQVQQFDLAQLR
jgi:hypothetical protein